MPPGAFLSREQILCHRRRVGGLQRRVGRTPAALRTAVHAGLQDSMPRAALLSLHARLETVGSDALADPALIQIWGPRYSCYVIAAEDRAVFTLGRLPEDARGAERAAAMADGLARLLGEGVGDDRGVGRELGVHPNALRFGATTGRVQIRWDGARAPEMWIVPAPDVDPAAARVELARRHLHVYGPAHAPTFAEWAGVSLRAARRTYAALASELLEVSTPIGPRAILAADEASFRGEPSVPLAPQASGVRLLPSGDAYFLLQGADRELLVPDPRHRGELWTSRVWPGALLLDGEIAGTWRRAGARVTVSAWARLSAARRQAVEAEAATLPLPGLEPDEITVSWTD